jgi:hypothetical protein
VRKTIRRVARALKVSPVCPLRIEAREFTRHHISINADEKQSRVALVPSVSKDLTSLASRRVRVFRTPRPRQSAIPRTLCSRLQRATPPVHRYTSPVGIVVC